MFTFLVDFTFLLEMKIFFILISNVKRIFLTLVGSIDRKCEGIFELHAMTSKR